MAGELRAGLSQTEGQRIEQAGQEAAERRSEIPQRKSDVAGQIAGYREEQAGARAAWQELATTMRGTRGVAVAPPPDVVPPPVVEEVAPAAEVAEAPAEIETDLTGRVFAFVADNPDGVRLTEMEVQFGLSRFAAARVANDLIEEGKLEKRDLLYFAV